MAKQLAEITYSKTNENSDFLKPLQPKTDYVVSEKDKKILKNVLDRFNAMGSARSIIDMDWQTWQKILEGKFYPYADWRTRVNVPLARALIELFVSEATSRKIEKDILPIWLSDIDKVEVMKEVWDVDWNKNRRDEAMTESEYKCAWFWTVFYFTWFEQTSRVINDPDDVNDDWTMSYTKKLMQQGRIILKTLDIRNVYLDDRTTNFDDDNDQIYVEYLTPEQFEAERNNPNYSNLEYVWTTNKTNQKYFTWEDLWKINTWLVEKIHYWNKQADRYIVIFNRSIVARDTPIPYAHKELPIVPRQYWYLPDSKYGRWLFEACLQFLDKYNRLSEMLFDWISRSNNSIFALWNWLTFDWQNFSFNNQIIKFNGNLNDANFREIKGIPPNQAAFQYLQDLLKEIAMFIWIDISQIIWQASWTAFEAAIRTESSLKRVNVVLTNRDYSLQKVFVRHLSNIMQFFPLSQVEQIIEVDWKWEVKKPKGKNYPKLLLEWKQYISETWKLVKAPWKYEFECKPEYIRGQMDIIVKTNLNSPSLKTLKQENMKRFLQDFNLYNQTVMASPDLKEVLKPDDFIKELAFTYDVDLSSIWWFADSITKQADEVMAIVRKMTWTQEDMWVLSWIWWQIPQETEQPQNEMLPNVWQKELPNVRTPEVPTIDNLNPWEKILL